MNASSVVRESRDDAAPPLVLLHGFMGAPASWSRVVAALQHAGAVHAPVLAGHGRSPRPVPPSFWDAVEQLAGELPARFYLAGYSLGGRLGMGLARRHPRRCLGLIAVGAHPGLATQSERSARLRWEEEQAQMLETCGLVGFVEAWEQLPLFASQAALPAEVRAAQRRIRESHDAVGLGQVLRAMGTGRMPRLDLERFRLPIVSVSGEQDPSAASASRLARIPGARHVTLPRVGHNPLLEAPERLAQLIDECCGVGSEARTLENHA